MRKFILFLISLLFVAFFGLCRGACAKSLPPISDKDDTGPGQFFYKAYDQQPWRLAESPVQLLEKSAGVAIASGFVFLYIRRRRKQA